MNLLEVIVAMVLFASMGTSAMTAWTTAFQATNWALADQKLGTVLDNEAENWMAGHPLDSSVNISEVGYTVTDSLSGSVREIQVQGGNSNGRVDVVETLY